MALTTIDESDLSRLVAERDRLLAQVTELQAAATNTVETSLARTVRTFMAKIGHTVRHTPEVPGDAEVRLRLKLVTEEFFELLHAALRTGTAFADAEECIKAAIAGQYPYQRAAVLVELPEFVDAMADLDYVVEGTRAAFGVHGAPIAAAVQAANMAKLNGGSLREDGKFLKPAGWTPPNIRGLLVAQGWQPPPDQQTDEHAK